MPKVKREVEVDESLVKAVAMIVDMLPRNQNKKASANDGELLEGERVDLGPAAAIPARAPEPEPPVKRLPASRGRARRWPPRARSRDRDGLLRRPSRGASVTPLPQARPGATVPALRRAGARRRRARPPSAVELLGDRPRLVALALPLGVEIGHDRLRLSPPAGHPLAEAAEGEHGVVDGLEAGLRLHASVGVVGDVRLLTSARRRSRNTARSCRPAAAMSSSRRRALSAAARSSNADRAWWRARAAAAAAASSASKPGSRASRSASRARSVSNRRPLVSVSLSSASSLPWSGRCGHLPAAPGWC